MQSLAAVFVILSFLGQIKGGRGGMVCGEDCMNKFDSNLFGMHPNLFWMDLNSMKYIGEVDVKLLMQISLYLGYPELGIFASILVGTVKCFKILDSQSASVLNTPGRYFAVIVIYWLKILLMSTNSCFFPFSSYIKLGYNHSQNIQHDLTPRIYVLHKITTALKFMSYINQKLRPSYQTALNLHILKISGRSARERAEQLATGGDHWYWKRD